jgi:cation diffusion facilitator CzcD-associated flavoprotein CzcO
VLAYLQAYARHFAIEPECGVTVRRVRPEGTGWRLETDGESRHTRVVALATGHNRIPVRPEIPGLTDFPGQVLHAAEFRNGEPFRGQRVLVVGAGNSGAEIALDLAEHGALPTLVVRGPVHVVPRELLGRPGQKTSILLSHLPRALADRVSLTILRLAVGDLTRWGIVRPALGPRTMAETQGRIPLIDIGTLGLIKQGRIAVAPALTAVDGATCSFADGRRKELDAIVLATGYRSGLETLLPEHGALLDEHGTPRVHGAAAAPGLYFIGYRVTATGILRDIARTAPTLADDIVQYLQPGASRE